LKYATEHADSSPSSSSSSAPASALRAYVDGPYGCPPSWALYDTCVLIAGGSGITYTLSILLDLVHRAQTGTSAMRRIVFVWIIRDVEQLDWIQKTLAAALIRVPPSLIVDLRAYITQTQPSKPIEIKTEQETKTEMQDYPNILEMSETPVGNHNPDHPPSSGSSNTSIKSAKYKNTLLPLHDSSLPNMKIESGRPDIDRLLREEVDLALGSVGVDVCGPMGLVRSVRSALSSDTAGPVGVLKGRPAVTLHVESFGW